MKMFSSLSFLFSLSLALIVWLILCYLKLIEEYHRVADYKVELYTEHTADNGAKQLICPILKNLELYEGFLWVFFSICAFIRLKQIIEDGIEKYMTYNTAVETNSEDIQLKNGSGDSSENGNEAEHLNQYEWEKQHLLNQIEELKAHCSCYMQRTLYARQESKSVAQIDRRQLQLASTKPDMLQINYEHSAFENLAAKQRNIFITNKHIYINGSIYLNAKQMNLNLPKTWTSSIYNRGNEFEQIWSRFIKTPPSYPMITSADRSKYLLDQFMPKS